MRRIDEASSRRQRVQRQQRSVRGHVVGQGKLADQAQTVGSEYSISSRAAGRMLFDLISSSTL